MEKSTSIKHLGQALMTFQTKMKSLKRDSTNPFFKKKYCSLHNILENISIPLGECNLAFTQLPDEEHLTTILIHTESGEYIQTSYSIKPVKADPQSTGSAITYARRYALTAILGLDIEDDDDGNAASDKEERQAGSISPNPKAEVNGSEQPPWISEAQFKKVLERIQKGDKEAYESAKKVFRIKKDYREQMEAALA
jgi:hypothetical protein